MRYRCGVLIVIARGILRFSSIYEVFAPQGRRRQNLADSGSPKAKRVSRQAERAMSKAMAFEITLPQLWVELNLPSGCSFGGALE